MIQEEKELLLKDLSGRLPYGVKASYYGAEEECECWDVIEIITNNGFVDIAQYELPVEAIKPYLFPLSCMTEEQFEDILDIVIPVSKSFINTTADAVIEDYKVDRYVDFCNKNHLDWRGLIPRGLAIDATGLNIY